MAEGEVWKALSPALDWGWREESAVNLGVPDVFGTLERRYLTVELKDLSDGDTLKLSPAQVNFAVKTGRFRAPHIVMWRLDRRVICAINVRALYGACEEPVFREILKKDTAIVRNPGSWAEDRGLSKHIGRVVAHWYDPPDQRTMRLRGFLLDVMNDSLLKARPGV